MASKKMNDMSRTLIESFVRSKLKGIKNDPDRSFRSMIDMGSHFAKSPFQKHFFTELQNIMADEHGNYYRLIQNIVAYVDLDYLLTFGLNVGYNSLTSGVKTIRYIEENKGVEVPWVISLMADGNHYDSQKNSYALLIEQGKRLGIYTWGLFVQSEPVSFLPLMKSQPECAFVLFVEPADITDDFLAEATRLKNLLIVVKYEEEAAPVCNQMRQRGMLYSVYITYNAENIDTIIEDEILYDVCELHPAFTFFLAANDAGPKEIRRMHQYVISTRVEQQYNTIPFDLDGDIITIQNVISDNSCRLSIDEEGYIYRKTDQPVNDCSNVFKTSLAKVLQRNCRKQA